MPIEKMLYQPPKLAMFLINLILPTHLIDTLLGDLLEEFQCKAEEDHKFANQWFWQQSLQTSALYFSKVFSSPSFAKKLNIFIPLCMLVGIILLVVWLSDMDELVGFSDGFWDSLLQGKLHMALFESAFWEQSINVLFNMNIWMFIDLRALLLATFNIGLLSYLNKTQTMSALRLAVWGYSLMLAPYVLSVSYLSNHALAPKETGPIIAMGILSLMYMLIPVSYMVNKKLKADQAKRFNKK
jgi:hypothetical protein